jgi:hypothetical protein
MNTGKLLLLLFGGRAFYAVLRYGLLAMVLAACTKQPQVQDLQTFLNSELPKDAPYSLEAIRFETSGLREGKELITFKAEVKLDRPLFRQTDTQTELRKIGWHQEQLDTALSDLRTLPVEMAKGIIETHIAATEVPTILEQVANAGDSHIWYGSVEAMHVVDKWTFSNLVTKERADFIGEPREKFGTKTYVLNGSDTAEALEATKRAHAAFIETVATHVQLAAERQSRQLAEKKAEEVIIAQEQTIRAAEAAKRRLPVELKMRTAAFAQGQKVLLVKNATANLLSIDMLVSDGQREKRFRFDLPIGRPVEVGWAQGWSFKPGDIVLIRNLAYDQLSLRIP